MAGFVKPKWLDAGDGIRPFFWLDLKNVAKSKLKYKDFTRLFSPSVNKLHNFVICYLYNKELET